MTTTQVAVVFPALLFWIMLIVQFGLWYHAKQVADAAAAEAADAAQVVGATDLDGETAADAVLAQSGNLHDVTIEVDRTVDRVVVTIQGSSPRLVPGFAWEVTGRADAPVERFVPEDER